jgi:hypothetical protein
MVASRSPVSASSDAAASFEMTSRVTSHTIEISAARETPEPRIQIFTIKELLHGTEVKMPPQYGTLNEAQRVHLSGGAHPQLDL